MAKGKKTGGRNFKIGKPGGPGRTPVPEDVRDSQKLNKFEFIRIANRFLYMTKAQIIERMNNPHTPSLEMIVATVISKAITQGDHIRLGFLLDRMIGKVKEKVEHSGPDDGPIKIDESISEEELDRRAAKIFTRLKEKFNEPK